MPPPGGRWTVVAAALVGLAGCATMTAEECARADWRTVGYTDGTSGYRASRLQRHADACGEHGYGVDPAAYRAGYREGRADYCSTTDPYQLGLDGDPYRGICDAAFGDAYRLGKQIHDYREAIDDLEREIRGLESDYADAGSDAERRRIRERIEAKREAIESLRERILATRAFGEDAGLLIDILD